MLKENQQLINILDDYLPKEKSCLTIDEISSLVKKVIKAHCVLKNTTKTKLLSKYPTLVQQLTEYVKEKKFITLEPGASLINSELRNSISRITSAAEGPRFISFKEYLKNNQGLPSQVVDTMSEDINNIAKFLALPLNREKFDVKGLVMGYVQSGKTLNYCGVINRAIEIGYDIIIDFSGVPSNLRNQGQRRVEEAVVGFNTETNEFTGISDYMGNEIQVDVITTRDLEKQNGDFNTSKAAAHLAIKNKKPLLFVCKKNPSVLKHLRKWLEKLIKNSDPSRKLTILIIDDETDSASINTEDKDKKPSTINNLIRSILDLFERKCYIGYTATPFANIFIYPENDDLFPKDFIYLLNRPSNYLGPFEFFGIDYRGIKIPPLPLVRNTDEIDEANNSKSNLSNELSPSLEEAINSFILAGAIKQLRGFGNAHHSMLIHISPNLEPQNKIARFVQEYINVVYCAIKKDFEGNKDAEASIFWSNITEILSDFNETSIKMQKLELEKDKDFNIHKYYIQYSLNDVKNAIFKFLQELSDVRELNEKSPDKLDYEKHEHNGLKVIVVGGNILSRGYTIEGLCTSYYTRLSLQADTVLQAGRWYGYRDSYKDLVRVYTTTWNQEILKNSAQAIFELQEQFKTMSSLNKSPKDFGFYMEEMIGKLKPTGRNRMRNSYIVTHERLITGDIAVFHPEDTTSLYNKDLTEKLIIKLGKPYNPEDISWRNVDTSHVLEYISNFESCQFARTESLAAIKHCIEDMKVEGKLTGFDVILPKIRPNENPITVCDYTIYPALRKNGIMYTPGNNSYSVTNGHALSSRHAILGLSQDELHALNKKYPLQNATSVHKIEHVMEMRNTRGMLVIYFYHPEFINDVLIDYGKSIKTPPVGIYIKLPNSPDVSNKTMIANFVYYAKYYLDNSKL